jgi:hypothetical protein
MKKNKYSGMLPPKLFYRAGGQLFFALFLLLIEPKGFWSKVGFPIFIKKIILRNTKEGERERRLHQNSACFSEP